MYSEIVLYGSWVHMRTLRICSDCDHIFAHSCNCFMEYLLWKLRGVSGDLYNNIIIWGCSLAPTQGPSPVGSMDSLTVRAFL